MSNHEEAERLAMFLCRLVMGSESHVMIEIEAALDAAEARGRASVEERAAMAERERDERVDESFYDWKLNL